MGKDRGAIVVRGEVLDVQLREGMTKTNQPYRFHILTVLVGKDTAEVRWSEDNVGPVPREDEQIEVEVGLDVFNGRQQIEAVKSLKSSVPAAFKAS